MSPDPAAPFIYRPLFNIWLLKKSMSFTLVLIPILRIFCIWNFYYCNRNDIKHMNQEKTINENDFEMYHSCLKKKNCVLVIYKVQRKFLKIWFLFFFKCNCVLVIYKQILPQIRPTLLWHCMCPHPVKWQAAMCVSSPVQFKPSIFTLDIPAPKYDEETTVTFLKII